MNVYLPCILCRLSSDPEFTIQFDGTVTPTDTSIVFDGSVTGTDFPDVSVNGEYTRATFNLKTDVTLVDLFTVKFEGGRPEDFKAFAQFALVDGQTREEHIGLQIRALKF